MVLNQKAKLNHMSKIPENLIIGKTYNDKILGKLLYIGRIGYELNMPHISKVKGMHIFVALNMGYHLITVTKREIQQLKK